jgi:peptidylprolyl isomerase/peptidyl-prolyl cis-trans isomerase B (cyclophilin B)
VNAGAGTPLFERIWIMSNLTGFTPVAHMSEERRTRFSAPEQVLESGKEYRAQIETNKGTMVFEVFPEQAPVTVNNFVFLALNRYYDGIVFHRVLEGFMAQTGDPTGTGTGGPGYEFADEFHNERRHTGVGVLSMANAGPGTNGSQFFITFTDTPWLDGRHTVFGKLLDGAEVLDKLQRIDPDARSSITPDKMEKVTIYER